MSLIHQVANWLNKETAKRLPEPLKNAQKNWRLHWPEIGVGGFQAGGETTRPDSLTAFSAVFACVNILSSDVSKLPFKVWKTNNETGGVTQAKNHALNRVIYGPNHFQTWMDLVQQFIVSLLMRGNGYILVDFNARNEPTAFYVLHPDRCTPHVDETTGAIFYQINKEALHGIDRPMMVPQRNIIHHRHMTYQHPLQGITPLHASALAAGTGLNMMVNSSQFFKNQARPSGVLHTDAILEDDVIARLKQQWNDIYSGKNAGKTAILEQGVQWEPLTMTAMDSQLIDQLKFSVQDVARAFRVPNFLLGDLDKVSYKNAETLNRVYLSSTLSFYLEAIENRFDTFFGLRQKGMHVEFDLDQFLRPDFEQRMVGYKTAVQGGIYSPNEARRREGLADVPGGDSVYMQQQMQPLESLEKGQPDKATPTEDKTSADDVRAAVRKLRVA